MGSAYGLVLYYVHCCAWVYHISLEIVPKNLSRCHMYPYWELSAQLVFSERVSQSESGASTADSLWKTFLLA